MEILTEQFVSGKTEIFICTPINIYKLVVEAMVAYATVELLTVSM